LGHVVTDPSPCCTCRVSSSFSESGTRANSKRGSRAATVSGLHRCLCADPERRDCVFYKGLSIVRPARPQPGPVPLTSQTYPTLSSRQRFEAAAHCGCTCSDTGRRIRDADTAILSSSCHCTSSSLTHQANCTDSTRQRQFTSPYTCLLTQVEGGPCDPFEAPRYKRKRRQGAL
jgi:hypothetical protein